MEQDDIFGGARSIILYTGSYLIEFAEIHLHLPLEHLDRGAPERSVQVHHEIFRRHRLVGLGGLGGPGGRVSGRCPPLGGSGRTVLVRRVHGGGILVERLGLQDSIQLSLQGGMMCLLSYRSIEPGVIR